MCNCNGGCIGSTCRCWCHGEKETKQGQEGPKPYIIKAGDFDSENQERQATRLHGGWTDEPFDGVLSCYSVDIIVRDKPKPPETLYCPIDAAEIEAFAGRTWNSLSSWHGDAAFYLTKTGNTYGFASNDEVAALRAKAGA